MLFAISIVRARGISKLNRYKASERIQEGPAVFSANAKRLSTPLGWKTWTESSPAFLFKCTSSNGLVHKFDGVE